MNATTPAPPPAGARTLPATRPWLRSYPPSVPPTIDEARIGTLADIFRDSRRRLCRTGRPSRASASAMTYAELGRGADAVASWLQAAGAEEGRSGRDHAAERHGLSGDPVRRAAGRRHGRQRQSALHAARADLSAQGFRRALPVRAREFRARRSRSRCRTCKLDRVVRRARPAICSASRGRSSIWSRAM